ncbi:MAG: prepilin-type N-terminal cleavage/methylation domain-containing protein [Phycisphaerae bacterium]|nr:prepilin-type N-terminal cleavage/methylation domain-containing protein [Gemmatimonadaceae bacterium]
MTRSRSGFTLIEVMTAITVTALVATVAAAALRAGLDVRERVGRHRVTVDAEARATEWIATMLRHPPVASAVEEPLLTIRRMADGSDSLTFLSQGVELPAGTGRIWRVTLHTKADGLHLHAVPLRDSRGSVPLESVLPHLNTLRVEALGPSTARGEWLQEWPVLRSMPRAVRLTFAADNGASRAPVVFATAPLSLGAL